MLTLSKKGGVGKIIIWIIILLIVIGAIYMVYKYTSEDNSVEDNQYGNSDSDIESGIDEGENVPNYDTEKPPLPPE